MSSHLTVLSKAAHSARLRVTVSESPTAHSLNLILDTIVRSAASCSLQDFVWVETKTKGFALATATSAHRANATHAQRTAQMQPARIAFRRGLCIASCTTTSQRSAPRKCNQSAEVWASHPVQRQRSAPRKCNQSVEY